MKTLFLLGTLLGGLSAAQAQFSYKEYHNDADDGVRSGQAVCVNQKGEVIRVKSAGDEVLLDHLAASNLELLPGKAYKLKNCYPHEITYLKNGGYAVAGRDLFMLLKPDKTFLTAIGGKMLDWRASNTGMDYWKCGTGGSTGTAVDFLELAENPSGTLVASLFIWHKMESGERQAIRLGLAVADMNNEGKSKLYDLGVETYSGSHNPIEASQQVEMGFIDDKHLAISNIGNFGENNYMVVDASLIAAGTPLEALKWKGNFTDRAPESFITDKGVLYYVHTSNTVGKAVWDGKKLTVKTEQKYDVRVSGSIDYIEDFDDQYFLIATHNNEYYKVSKSDLGLTYLGKINLKYGAKILDVKPLDAAKNQVVVLMRENANSSSPGPFHLGILQLK